MATALVFAKPPMGRRSKTGQVPSSPQGLGVVGSADAIQLSWAPAAGANFYTLYFTTTGAPSPSSGTPIVGVTSPYIHQGGLLAGTTYSYVVTASNIDGESAASNVASAVVGATGGDVGSITSTIPPGYFVDVNLKNLTTDESMDGIPDSAIILFVRTTQGAAVAGLHVAVSGGITAALSDVGNGRYQSVVANHLLPGTFTFTLSGTVNGSVVVELSTMPNCSILTPTLNQALPVGQDIEATWSLQNTEFVGILVEDALGSVSYSMNGQDPNVNPWFTPAPPGLILPGGDFTTAGPWTLKLTAGWLLSSAVGTASVRGLYTCKQSAVLQ
ncbi:MAG: fibronectin type III domain-containing protein [Deltaproteobacteria bacterium]|nr:fibronectin type III domain-containing protein [Deltaproteobacteria bacterium]